MVIKPGQKAKRSDYRGDRGWLQNFFLIDHIIFIAQERQPKLISSERVICQPDFHQALKLHTHVVLEQ